MKAILLHELSVIGDAREEKRHQRNLLLSGHLLIDGVKLASIIAAVIGGQTHAQQQHPRALIASGDDELHEIFPHLVETDATQAVVPAESNDDDGGLVADERRLQYRNRRTGGLATDAQVNDPEVAGFLLQAVLQQADPTAFRSKPVGRAQAVAQHQDRRGRLGGPAA